MMSDDPLIGKVLHDTHEVLRLIGKGGMGSVYEARHIHLNKSFAVKVLDPRFAENDTVFARFKREALIASSIGHPAIVQVSDFYLHEDGRPCMVMEYMEGQDLGEVLKERKSLPPEEVVEIVEQVAGALQAVHDQDIVHRDMKPGNIFLVKTTDGTTQAKVLDFGISKIKNPEDGVDTLTAAATILGTPHFMSPEQALGEVGDVDWRTDIFALGTICYYALCGKLPFNAPSLHGVLVKIQTMEPPPITGLATGLTGKAHLALQKAMAKEKTDRYDRVEEFAADLKAGLAVPAPASEEAETPEFATMVDVDAKPSGEKEPEEAPGQPSLSALPAEDPNMTNVLPLDELLGEVGQAEEATEDEVETEEAAEDSESPAQEEAKVGEEPIESPAVEAVELPEEEEREEEGSEEVTQSPAPEKAMDQENPAEPPVGENTQHLEVEDLEEVRQADEEAAEPAQLEKEEASPEESESPLEEQEPAASPVKLAMPASVEEEKPAEAKEEEEPSGVSPHTTLSGSAGEMPTENIKQEPERKPLPSKALAAAAVLVLVIGGAYILLRGPEEQPDLGGGEPGVAAAAPMAAAPSATETPEEPQEQQPVQEATGATAPAQEPAAAKKPAQASKVRISLELTPPGAKVLVDGRPTANNPLLLKKNRRPYKLRIEAAGHAPHEQDLMADADRVLKIELQKTRPAPTPKPKRAEAKATDRATNDWEDPFKKQRRPPKKMKKAKDEAFSTLEVPGPKPKPRKKKKEEAFDSL